MGAPTLFPKMRDPFVIRALLFWVRIRALDFLEIPIYLTSLGSLWEPGGGRERMMGLPLGFQPDLLLP